MANQPATSSPRPRMPGGIRVFLVYAFAILVVIGLSMRFVIDLAISSSVSLIGVVVMILLAYTIFTITVILQRKEVGRGLALGLATLTIPAIPLAFLTFNATGPRIAGTVFVAALSLLLFRGLLAPEVRTYLDQP